MSTLKVTLELMQEKKEAIIQFINFNDWNVEVEEVERPKEGNYCL